MSEDVKFWATFILALVGALAWIPTVIVHLKKISLRGKIISRYVNYTEGKKETLILYKLSIILLNKSFNLKQIRCEIVDKDGNSYKSTAGNWREIKFCFGESNKEFKCTVNGNEYLNNHVQIPANISVPSYLFFKFHVDLERQLESTKFIFESFEGEIISLVFKEAGIQGGELWFDDSVWEATNQD